MSSKTVEDKGRRALSLGLALLVIAAMCTATVATSAVAEAAPCPEAVNPAKLAGKRELRELTAQFNRFGPRILGSAAHNRAIAWLEDRAEGAGLEVDSTRFRPYAWLPKTHRKDGRGLDIGAAGAITVRKPGARRSRFRTRARSTGPSRRRIAGRAGRSSICLPVRT